MHIAQLRLHPTDANIVVLTVAADVNPIMGRFEPARLSTEHGGYLVHTFHLDALGRFLALNGVVLVDDRIPGDTPTPPPYARHQEPILRCVDCGWTQRADSCHPRSTRDPDECGMCNRCHRGRWTGEDICGGELRPHLLTQQEQIDINRRGRALVAANWRGLKTLDDA